MAHWTMITFNFRDTCVIIDLRADVPDPGATIAVMTGRTAHCRLPRNWTDKCYKLHGSPLGHQSCG